MTVFMVDGVAFNPEFCRAIVNGALKTVRRSGSSNGTDKLVTARAAM
jgi:hypothetical protein